MGDKEKKFKDKEEKKKKDCGCGSPNCDCGDDCDCTPEDNCGCNCCNHPDDDHDSNGEHKDCHCDEHCDCEDDCDCHEHDGCNCGHEHDKPTEADYQALFAQLQHALIEGEKQLQKAKNDAMDNQRIAVSYKKDLERYKERNANIQEEAQNNAIENIATKLVPILDQFETALNATADSSERKGFEMIYSGLRRAVADLGVEELKSLGEKFDSNLHNAVNKVIVQEQEKDGTVTAVYQKGYKLTKTNKIIRYAMVEVGEYVK